MKNEFAQLNFWLIEVDIEPTIEMIIRPNLNQFYEYIIIFDLEGTFLSKHNDNLMSFMERGRFQ